MRYHPLFVAIHRRNSKWTPMTVLGSIICGKTFGLLWTVDKAKVL